MAFIMVSNIFPPDKANEFGKTFVELSPLPPFLKTVGLYATSTELGIKGYALFEIEDEKLAEGIRE